MLNYAKYAKHRFVIDNTEVTNRGRWGYFRKASKHDSPTSQLSLILGLPISKLRVQQIFSAQNHGSVCSMTKALPFTDQHKKNRSDFARLRLIQTRQQCVTSVFQMKICSA